MSENYTAEDFARATLATRGEYMVARRCGADRTPWAIFLHNRPVLYVTDASMVLHGWVPVVESRVTEHTLRDAREKADRKRQKSLDHIAWLEAVMRRRNDEIAALRRELADAQAPLSLESLAAAYEAAEEADECREGDVLMRKLDGGYSVYRAHNNAKALASTIRILSRAPREPWADLADVLRAWDAEPADADADGMAKWFHERGVRVTGGEES